MLKVSDFCLHCESCNPTIRCSACKKAWYCGRSCQNKHWIEFHRKDCKEMFHVENDPANIYVICLSPGTVVAFQNAEPQPNTFKFHPHMVWQGRSLQVLEMNTEIFPFVSMDGIMISQTSCAYTDKYLALHPVVNEFEFDRKLLVSQPSILFLWVTKRLQLDLPLEIVEMILCFILSDTVLTRYTPKQVVPLRGPNVYVAYLDTTEVVQRLLNVLFQDGIR